MDLLSRHRAALLVLGLYLVLGILYSIVVPVFEASDEITHYPFVAHLAQGGDLPVQRAGEQTLWMQEGSQPPLYYALAAGLTAWIDTTDLPALRYLNPHAQIGIPLATDNKNMVVHTEREAFPWHGAALAVHLIRFFSLLLGAGTVLCTYLLARALIPDRAAIAPVAMALNAFLPMFLFISASVNNDNLVIFLSSLTLLLLVRGVSRVEPRGASRRQALLVGILIGLACLSKLSALGLAPLAAAAFLYRRMRCHSGDMSTSPLGRTRPMLREWNGDWAAAWIVDCLVAFVPVLLIAGWWYVRNWLLYGDPTGTNLMLAIAGRRPVSPGLGQLLREFEGFRINFWGLFGGVNVLMRPLWVYRILDVVSVLALLGLAAWGWQQRRGSRSHGFTPTASWAGFWPGLGLSAGWLLIEAVLLVRWTMSTFASQGRLIFPAVTVICLFLALGLVGGLPARWQRGAAWPIGGLLFLLAASVPFSSIRTAYARPAILTAGQLPASAQPFRATYDGSVRLLAYEVGTASVRPGDSVPVTCYWQPLRPITDDLSIYIQLFGLNRQRLAQIDTYPGGGTYPTSLWSTGQVIRDTYQVPVRPDALGPVAAQLEVGLYRLADQDRLRVVDGQGNPAGQPVLAHVKIAAAGRPASPHFALNANLAGRVRLVGYDLADGPATAGSELPITLYWQVLGCPGANYTVFVQLLSTTDKIAGQGDGPPLDGQYPTSYWEAGELVADTHSLAIAPDALPGQYRIVVGLYLPASGERLPVVDATGKFTGDRVPVTTVEVEP